MEINTYQSNHFFENRLYLSPMLKSEIPSTVHSEAGVEYSGAGVRCYSQFIGWLLSFFGLASKLNIGSESFYINHKSFSKFIIRSTELGEVHSAKEAAQKLHELFIKHQKCCNGYKVNKINLVNNSLKRILSTNEIKNIFQMILHLKMIAIHEGAACD